MITKRTVFVLGAGASAPYGFPSGSKLADDIRVAVSKDSKPLRNLLLKHFSSDLVQHLPVEFMRSGQYSLDAFVERRPEFREVVKAAIVHKLALLENDAALITPTPNANGQDADWCRYLINKIVASKPDRFSANRLKVVTFNFDRSFERRLFVALRSAYRISPKEAEELLSAVPMLHIHGDLGEPGWLPSFEGSSDKREYAPDDLGGEAVTLATRLNLVDDEIPPTRLATAREWLAQAEAVCFLGFGYHPLNLRRLDVGRLPSSVVVRGTALSVAPGERGAVRRAFPDNINIAFTDPNVDILQFLRDTDFIHD